MKKLLGVLAASAMGVSMVVTSTPAQAADIPTMEAKASCTYHWSADYAKEEYATFSEVYYGVEVYYKNCPDPRKGVTRRAQPRSFYTLCRSDGPAADPNWAHFNLYFFDKDGHTYNPTYKSMECPDQNKYAEKVFYANTTKWFHMCDVGGPRWNADLKVDYGWGHGQDTAFLSSVFWGFSGPVNTNC